MVEVHQTTKEMHRMSDIVERLRAISLVDLRAGPILAHTLDTAREAADEIERLRAEVERLQEQGAMAVALLAEVERLRAAVKELEAELRIHTDQGDAPDV